MREVRFFLCLVQALLIFISICVTAAPVAAAPGSGHKAAMAEVQRGIDLCPTGNLDGAMAIFKRDRAAVPGGEGGDWLGPLLAFELPSRGVAVRGGRTPHAAGVGLGGHGGDL